MAATPTTRAQVQAYRFVLRRMEHALVRKDAVMLHDPMRTQARAAVVGLVAGVLALAVFALLSVLSPRDDVSQGTIFVGKTSLTTYVVLEEGGQRVLHPVLNVASARLVAGTAAPVAIVADSSLAKLPRGPLLGIPGAPDALPGVQDRPAAVWTVCDRTAGATGSSADAGAGAASTTTSVLVGDLALGAEGVAQPLAADQALYVRSTDGTDQLLYDGRRAEVASTPAVRRALNLSGRTPRPVSAGLLNAVPAVPLLDVPTVPGAGQVPSFSGGRAGAVRVGDVVDVTGVDGTDYFVVLADGTQPVNPVVAALLVSRAGDVVDLTSAQLGNLPEAGDTSRLQLDRYPEAAPDVLDAAADPVVCLSWNGTGAAASPGSSDPSGSGDTTFTPRSTLLAGGGLPLPEGARAVPLAASTSGASAASTGLDSFYLRPGQGAVVQGRDTGAPAGDGTRYLVSDTGTRFGIDTAAAADVLGLGTAADPAPSAVLALLPQGPALDRASALRAHDGVAADPSAVQLPVPTTGG